MAEFPALTLWTDAYLSDTRHLSTVEHGAYLLLLMEAWRRPHCDLPDDDKILSRLAGLSIDEWVEIKETVMAFWKRDGRSKTWSQKRLSLERGKAKVRSKSQSDKAAKRWYKTKKRDAAAKPNRCPDDASTATAITIEEESNDSSLPLIPHRDADWIEIPDWMPVEPWNGWLDMRKDKRKWPTPRAIELAITDLTTWRAKGHDPGRILDTSTLNNWTGLFEPKENPNGQHRSQPAGNTRGASTIDLARQAAAGRAIASGSG